MKFALVSSVLPPADSAHAAVLYRLLRDLDPQRYCLISAGSSETESSDRGALSGTRYHLPPAPSLTRGYRMGLRLWRERVNFVVGVIARARAIARILRAKPEVAIDRTAASGEYCFKSGPGSTMVHFAVRPEGTPEDVIYELDASGLIAAGLDPARLNPLPELGRMTPGVWYFLPTGQLDPHHAHAMSSPMIAIAVDVK